MFVDARTIPNGDVVSTDICIVGAGAAGITLARKLSGQQFRVALLESGGLDLDADTFSLYVGKNTGIPYFPLETSRLRYFGGTTNHWGGHCRPFDTLDFEARAGIPRSGWPIRKTDLDDYYVEAQEICGLGNPAWDLETHMAQDRFAPLPIGGDRLLSRFAQVIRKQDRSFGRNYRAAVETAANVTTYLNANVTQIELDDMGGRVTGLQVACLSGTGFRVEAQQFIIALGGLENARLLLLSNKQQPAGVGNGRDLVGRFFLEHPRFEAGRLLPVNKHLSARFYEPHDAGKRDVKGYLALSEETLRREEISDIQITLAPVYERFYVEALESREIVSLRDVWKQLRNGTAPDPFGNHIANIMDDVLSWQESAIPLGPFPLPKPLILNKILQTPPEQREQLISELVGDIALVGYEEVLGSAPLEHISVITRIDPIPNPDSRVTLGAERDKLGQPRIELNWQLMDADKRSVKRALEILGAEVGRAGIGRLQVIFDEQADWPSDIAGGWHHMGTTRMSDDPTQGVVDRNCKVHGLGNLYIAGSSVFPTAGSGTPTLMLLSLALRLADHLKEQMG